MFTFKFESLIIVVLDFLVSLHPERGIFWQPNLADFDPPPLLLLFISHHGYILLDEWRSTTVFVVARLNRWSVPFKYIKSQHDGKDMNFYRSNFPFWYCLFFAPKNIHLQSIHSKEKNDQKDGFSKVPFDPSSLQRENDGLALLNVGGC